MSFDLPSSSLSDRWTLPTADELQVLLPQYEILALLGHGGMGAVYSARQRSLNRKVAIKILPPQLVNDELKFAERFKNEAQTIAKFSHPSIIHVYDFGETTSGLLYFAMEYVDGTDIATLLAKQSRLPAAQAIEIAKVVCQALQYAHARGVIHRDIKPANILIDQEGQVKVADFGLSKINDPMQASGLTRTNVAIGTQEFAAPEMLTSGATVDHRADLYSLGVMLYQMLTGEIPRVMFKLPSRCRPELGTRFDALICRALETDPEDRFPSAAEMGHELELAANPTITMSEPKPSIRRGSFKRLWMSGAAVVILVIAGVSIFALKDKPPTPTTAHTETQNSETLSPQRGDWIKLLDTPAAAARTGIKDLEWKDGWLTVTSERLYLGRLAGVKDKVRDMAFRVTVRPPTNEWPVAAVLHSGADPQYFLDVHRDCLTLRRVKQAGPSKQAFTELGYVPLDLRQAKDGAFQIEASIQGNLITVIADGAKVLEVRDEGAAGVGDIALVAPSETQGTGKIKDVAFRLLDESVVATEANASADVKRHENNASIWTDWLGPNRKSLPPTWIVGPDGVTTTEEIVGHDVLPNATADAAMRVSYISSRGHGMRLTMRERGTGESRECYLVQDEHDQIELCKVGPGKRTVILASKNIPADWNPSAERVMEFRAAGDLLSASLNGSLTLSFHDARLTSGPSALSVVRGVLLKTVEIESLGLVR